MFYEYAPDPYVPADLQGMCPAGACALCGDELYYGQCCYCVGQTLVCEGCLAEYARAYFRTCRVCLRRDGVL